MVDMQLKSLARLKKPKKPEKPVQAKKKMTRIRMV